MEKEMNYLILKNQVKKEINKNIFNGNDSFEILFDFKKLDPKDLRKLKKEFKQLQIITHSYKDNKNNLILSINFNNSPAIKLLRTIYGIER